jgi:hypothetical protein
MDAAAAADATSSSSSSRVRAVFEISNSSDYVRVAGGLEGKISAQGWAEVTCRGREDYALPVLIQVGRHAVLSYKMAVESKEAFFVKSHVGSD